MWSVSGLRWVGAYIELKCTSTYPKHHPYGHLGYPTLCITIHHELHLKGWVGVVSGVKVGLNV